MSFNIINEDTQAKITEYINTLFDKDLEEVQRFLSFAKKIVDGADLNETAYKKIAARIRWLHNDYRVYVEDGNRESTNAVILFQDLEAIADLCDSIRNHDNSSDEYGHLIERLKSVGTHLTDVIVNWQDQLPSIDEA